MAKKEQVNPTVNKQIYKHSSKECKFCKEDNYASLNVHRIVPGSEGGKYTKLNTVVICANCHAKVHAGLITIHGWQFSTAGLILHYEDEEGKEHFE